MVGGMKGANLGYEFIPDYYILVSSYGKPNLELRMEFRNHVIVLAFKDGFTFFLHRFSLGIGMIVVGKVHHDLTDRPSPIGDGV